MNIYLAARYGRRAQMLDFAGILEWGGHEVTSRWIWGEHEAKDASPTTDESIKWATDDIIDLIAADMLISFTEEPDSPHGRGGRHVEFGFALAQHKEIVIIGPVENIFYAGFKRYGHEANFLDDFMPITFAASEVRPGHDHREKPG